MSLAHLPADAPLLTAKPGPACTVCELLADLAANDPSSHERLAGWLADPRVRYGSISDLVRDHLGADIMTNTWSRHARGKCAARSRLR